MFNKVRQVSLWVGVYAICGSALAAELLYVEECNDYHAAYSYDPPPTMGAFIDRLHKTIKDNIGHEYTDVSGWKDYNKRCEPTYLGADTCSIANACTKASFVKKEEWNEDWQVIVTGRSGYDRSGAESRARVAREDALEKAKFACSGDVKNDARDIHVDEYSHDGVPDTRITMLFNCIK